MPRMSFLFLSLLTKDHEQELEYFKKNEVTIIPLS